MFMVKCSLPLLKVGQFKERLRIMQDESSVSVIQRNDSASCPQSVLTTIVFESHEGSCHCEFPSDNKMALLGAVPSLIENKCIAGAPRASYYHVSRPALIKMLCCSI